MQIRDAKQALDEAIALTSQKGEIELIELREQFRLAFESLKPGNMIKNTLSEVNTYPDLKENMLSNVIGLATGFLTKKALVGNTHNPLKRFFGMLLQFAVASVVTKHSDGIKAVGGNILHSLLKLSGKPKEEPWQEGEVKPFVLVSEADS